MDTRSAFIIAGFILVITLVIIYQKKKASRWAADQHNYDREYGIITSHYYRETA